MSRIAAAHYEEIKDREDERHPSSEHEAHYAAGRDATHPKEIPSRGWWAILKRTYQVMTDKDLGLMCAGVAFYGFLSIFPIIAAIVLIYGLVATPESLAGHLDLIRPLLPAAAMEIIDGRLESLVNQPASSLGWGLLLSLGLALWSGSRGTNSLILAIGEAYHEDDRRGFVASALLSVGLTLGAILFLGFAIAAIAVLPAILNNFALGPTLEPVLNWIRWPILLAAVIGVVTVLYRLAPDRDDARWRWLVPGAAVATVLWMILSIGFTIYAENFGSYSASFGSLAGAVVLMFWIYYSTMAFVFGAALNGQMELQTRRDTTVGGNEPMGTREAFVADHTPRDVAQGPKEERPENPGGAKGS